MAFAYNTKGGQLQIKDTLNAIDKDTRTLFSYDNAKNHKKKASDIPELHLLSYYGDITGANELHLRNRCLRLIQSYLENLTTSNRISVARSIFDPVNIEIMHISHYSFEFVVNVSNKQFLDDHKLNDTEHNHYLVGTYQKTEFDTFFDEFVTIGMTTSVSHSNNSLLYNFYVDDFIQDLYKILRNTLWYDKSCELPLLLWYEVAKYTMDCILPVTYTKRSNEDEIVLDDGRLHIFLTGKLNAYNNNNNNNNNDDDSGDVKESDHIKDKIDSTLEIIGRTFVDFGRILHNEYTPNKNMKKLKSEYDKWKKQGFKKRENIKPLNMRQLIEKLKYQQAKREQANDLETINELKYLYYKNPNFQIKFGKNNKIKNKNKHRKSKTTMQSFKHFFSFGSSNNKKQIRRSSYSQNIQPINLMNSKTDEAISATIEIARSRTEPFNNKKDKKNKKNKTQKKQKKKAKMSAQIQMNGAASLPPFNDNDTAQSESRSKSAGHPKKKNSNTNKNQNQNQNQNKNKNQNKNNYMTISMLYNTPSYDTMDDDDDDVKILLPDTNIAETQSADSVYNNMKRIKSGKLAPTLRKPHKGRSVDVTTSPYSHDENVVMYLSYDQIPDKNTNKHKRQESSTTIKIRREIKIAHKNYESDRGKMPIDIQSFVNYCKKKNIKKANWSLCQSVINEMKINISDTIVE